MDTVNKETRSRVMSTVRSKHTRLEESFATLLEKAGVKGFTRYAQDLPGTPDFAFLETKVAVFIDSCFWHGCPQHLRKPNSNQEYWKPKIANNINRDARTDAALQAIGWTVIRIWEHELKEPGTAVEKVLQALDQPGIK